MRFTKEEVEKIIEDIIEELKKPKPNVIERPMTDYEKEVSSALEEKLTKKRREDGWMPL